ncbi:MAG: hypothetical protein NTY07_01735 [Bacteroidia bacterium]|nr:hypothetical protein [Bacteroidia bacterium]
MKACISLLFIFLLQALYVDGQEIFNPPIKPNTAFIAGEIITYQIRYGFIERLTKGNRFIMLLLLGKPPEWPIHFME